MKLQRAIQRAMKRRRRFLQVFALAYVLTVIVMCITRTSVLLTLLGRQDEIRHVYSVYLVPFHSFFNQKKIYGHLWFSTDARDNVIMFVVFGLLYCYFQKKTRLFRAFISCLLTSLCIETMQFLLKTGTVDIDDVLMNCLGGLVGILVYVVLRKVAAHMKIPTEEAVAVAVSFLPPLFLAYLVNVFAKQEPLWFNVLVAAGHLLVSVCYFAKDFSPKGKAWYAVCFLVIFGLFRVVVLKNA